MKDLGMTEESFDSIMAKAHENLKENGCEQESDCEETNYDKQPITSLFMLFQKIQVSDIDFTESCQDAGLIARTSKCSCGSKMSLRISDIIDGAEWKCSCPKRRSIKDGTWLDELRQMRLKDIILVLYCWCHSFSEQSCQHEVGLREHSTALLVPMIYKKCKKLCSEYFEHEISNIGSAGDVVEIENFQAPNGLHIIGGCERRNMKNVFFRVLPENWNRDDLCTAIIDNVVSGTIVHCHNATVFEILGTDGLRYLDKKWKLKVIKSGDCDSPLVTSLWALFERLILDKDYTQSNLVEFLFRRRMETHHDPFLFLLDMIAVLHPPATVMTDYDLNQIL